MARADGLALQEVTPGPHVGEAQVEQRLQAAERRGSSARADDKPETGGDSPNPFYDVFRSYSEPGGIQDEMESLAFANPGLAKLVVIGKSGRGRDIVALKVTQNAGSVADGARPAMLFSAVNHAREWIAAEMGRRMPAWWIEHADDPQIAELLSRNELWFLPIQNVDGYEYTFTCGTGMGTAVNEMCGATLVTDPSDPLRGTYVYKTADGIVRAPNNAQPNPALRKPTNRLWRKTRARQRRQRDLRRRPGRRRPEPQLPDRVGSRRRGFERERVERHLPRPVSAVGARGPRVRPAAAEDHARGDHQLPLGGAAAAVPVRLHHRRLRRRRRLVQGDHGHGRRRGDRPVHLAAVVGPLHHQRRDDRPRVQQVRVDVVDAGARRVRDGGRRHVLQRRLRLHVPRRREQGRGGLPEEPRLRPQRGGDDARSRPSRPPAQRHGRRDAVPGQGLAGHRAQPVQRLLRRGTDARGDDAPDPRPGRLRPVGLGPRRRRSHDHAARHAVARRRALRRPARQVLPAREGDGSGRFRPARDGTDAAAAGRR